MTGWKSKLARVSRMDREELRVRSAQELHKRRDWFLYRMGLQQGRCGLIQKEMQAALANSSCSPEMVRRAARLLREFLPEEAKAILQEADEICGRRFRLLGYENLSFRSSATRTPAASTGISIRCTESALQSNRGSRFHFLDFAVVGDHKVTWELNRHQHLITLAKAWLLSREERYLRELIIEWHNWIAENPYPIGINWGSSLEVAFRSLSWIWVDQLLAVPASRALKRDSAIAGFRAELRAALAFHGRYVERFLSTYFSPNTHLLGEAVAFFFLGTLYPLYAAREPSGKMRDGRSCSTRPGVRSAQTEFISNSRCTTTCMRWIFFSMRDCSRRTTKLRFPALTMQCSTECWP